MFDVPCRRTAVASTRRIPRALHVPPDALNVSRSIQVKHVHRSFRERSTMLPSCRRRRRRPPSSPPWEVLKLVSQSLDPESLAAASCVSKSWRAVFSSDHLWQPLCHSHFPSSLHLTPAASASPRHLFLLLRAASIRRRRAAAAPPPLPLRRLLFMVDVFQRGAPVFSLARAGEDLASPHKIFRFDVPVPGEAGNVEADEAARVVWTVATAECREAFVLMDHVEKGRSVGGNELWFSEKLPCPAACCCTSAADGGRLEAQVLMELSEERYGGGGRRRVEKVCLGLMDCKDWRFAKEDDGLLYLQSVLLPFGNDFTV